MGDLLYGLVRQIKPDLVFEDGAGMGHATYMLGKACLDNGKGKVVSCENNESYYQIAAGRVEGLPVDMQLQSTPCCPAVEDADFIFADGDNENRMKCFDRAKPGCVFVIHDTNEKALADFVRAKGGLVFNFGRGFGLIIK